MTFIAFVRVHEHSRIGVALKNFYWKTTKKNNQNTIVVHWILGKGYIYLLVGEYLEIVRFVVVSKPSAGQINCSFSDLMNRSTQFFFFIRTHCENTHAHPCDALRIKPTYRIPRIICKSFFFWQVECPLKFRGGQQNVTNCVLDNICSFGRLVILRKRGKNLYQYQVHIQIAITRRSAFNQYVRV